MSVADKEVSVLFNKIMTKHGVKIYTNHKVTSGKNHGDHGSVTFEPVSV
jgi:pyruvate/2-oxoglutarate dehydrogenase complex dihydrolipoamide dehydrogenase (E3) component